MRAFLIGIGTVLAAASRRCFEDTDRTTTRKRLATGVAVACLLSLDAAAAGPRTWYEIKSPHFVLWSDSNNGNARDVAWQFEQVRSVVTALWPWAKVDLPRPIRVLAVKDENGMKALAPEYWERRGAVHPASVWVEAADRDYMVVRADLDTPSQGLVNPYTNTYFSYAYLILTSSLPHRLPLWMSRGLAGVVSNTVIRDKKVLMGPPIPWHLEALRDRPHLRLTELVAVTEQTPGYRQGDFLSMFDAESWAFVHFLMFGSNGAHRAQVNAFVKQVADGAPPAQAFAETIGKPEDLESPFSAYINRNLFSFLQLDVNAGVPRERFDIRPLTPAESASDRALFHVAMHRPNEAQKLIAEARAAKPDDPDATLAEALLFDRGGQKTQATAAYERAVEEGTTDAYGWYRAATSNWPRPDAATLARMDQQLSRATELNPFFADAWADLAEVRSLLKQPSASVMPLIAKAIGLEPSDPWHRMTEARILWTLESPGAARQAANVALSLADSDAARLAAQQLLASLK